MDGADAEPGVALPRAQAILPAIFVALAVGLTLTLLVNIWVGAAGMAFGLVLALRPFDPFVGALLAAGAATFAAYGEHGIQRDMAIVTALTAYAVLSFAVANQQRRWHLPSSRFVAALFLLALTTAAGVIHGVAAHHKLTFIYLEVLPLFSLGFAVVIGGLRLRRVDPKVGLWGLAMIGIASAAAGLHFYGSTGIRTGGMAFSPVPGLVALVFLSVTLFDPSPRPKLLPVFVFCVLVGHQVVTFTRGFWLGLLGGIPLICWLYVRRGPGAKARWSKVVATLGLALFILAVGVTIAATRPPWNELVGLLGNRFTSSFTTKNTPETVSNIARLVEIRTSITALAKSPVFGLGHGSTLVVHQFFHPEAGPQWYIHQGYLMMWLKQGVFGVISLLWLLFLGFRMGWRGASLPDPEAAGWNAGAAACALFVTSVGLTNYFFFNVNQSFVLAFIWGVALSTSKPGVARMVWRSARPSKSAPVEPKAPAVN
jgi:hypothetical protein